MILTDNYSFQNNFFVYFKIFVSKYKLTNVYTLYILLIEIGVDYMEAKLQKWGNSDGIRIPSSILKTLKLKTNDKLDLQCVDDKIIISYYVKNCNTFFKKVSPFF